MPRSNRRQNILEVLARELETKPGSRITTAALAAAVDEAKATLGLRVQAVLIGDRETVGLLELADAVFWVRDWRRFGGSKAASPVHDKSLTALYFPGALRNPENRARTVSPEAAAAAVRAGLHRGENQ